MPDDLHGRTVLEIGAGKYSCLAPAFAKLGATVSCSYYGQARQDVESGQLRVVSERHGIGGISVIEVDIHAVRGVYDIIVLKSVLGGICRGDERENVRAVIDGLMDHLTDGGVILTIDNGRVAPFAKLSRTFGAGRNRWTYFTQADIQRAFSGLSFETRGFGFLNIGALRFLFSRDWQALESVNDAIHGIDRLLLRHAGINDRAVIATVIRKDGQRTTRPALAARPTTACR
ncbi:hypothetical protein ACIU1J_23675 [Azospirillum doebereinerae]|uniref:hypothetical protein n=1 Tax=Azospirillum doebereinerae TaxID=92933 RepID=UPI001EE59D3D|nr:hypothetical protein [Azospirillum doebereinerae]MCG5238781.1 hypothetical protein [Azospirillum doebereinerae]